MRFVVCGEALIDLIPKESVSTAESTWSALCGGGPLNTAIALARLGLPVQFLGRLGADSFGTQLRSHLQKADVGLDLVVDTDQPTSLAVVSLDDQGRAQYTFHFNETSNFGWRDDEFPELEEDDWLHFGSISSVIRPGARAIRRFVSNTNASVSFDINVRPTVQPDKLAYLEDVVSLLEVVGAAGGVAKSSDEDITLLVGEDEDPISFAQTWVENFGLSLFLVTLGPEGALAIQPGDRITRVPGRQVELADTVGAGDTFMAGFLSRFVDRPDDVEAALNAGVAASAFVCTRHGANPPTNEELEAFLV